MSFQHFLQQRAVFGRPDRLFFRGVLRTDSGRQLHRLHGRVLSNRRSSVNRNLLEDIFCQLNRSSNKRKRRNTTPSFIHLSQPFLKKTVLVEVMKTRTNTNDIKLLRKGKGVHSVCTKIRYSRGALIGTVHAE